MEIQQRWRKFAEVYVETGGDRKKAVAAFGYTGKWVGATATRLLKHDPIVALIDELNEKGKERAIEGAAATKADVLALIDETIDLARTGVPVIGKNGQPVSDPYTREVIFKPDITGMQRGAQLKGQTIAMFTEVHKQVGEMEGKSLEELFLAIEAVLSDPVILTRFARLDAVRDKVHELDRGNAGSRGSDAGGSAPEAESLQPAPEAIDIPQGRFN